MPEKKVGGLTHSVIISVMQLIRSQVRYLAIFVAAAILALLPAAPVLAVTDPLAVTLESIYINRDLLQDDDMLIVGFYNIVQASVPNVTIDQTYLFRVVDTDGITELASTHAFPYVDNGYGQGVVSWYFANDTAPAWGESYFLVIQQSPVHFAAPLKWTFSVGAGDYSAAISQTQQRQEVGDQIRDLGYTLGNAWGITLIEAQDAGDVLSASGELYFRNVIFGLQTMAPHIFFVQTLQINFTERAWGTTQADTYRDRYDGTWVGDATAGMSGMLKLNEQLMMSGILLVVSVLLMWQSQKRFQTTHPGMLASSVLVTGGALQGWIAMAGLAIAGLFLIIYVGYFWFFNKA